MSCNVSFVRKTIISITVCVPIVTVHYPEHVLTWEGYGNRRHLAADSSYFLIAS